MQKKYRSWIPGIVFWVLFLGSLALGRRYWWIDTIWKVVWLVFLVVVGICATVGIFRNRNQPGRYVGYRGVPLWVVRLVGGEVKQRNEPVPNSKMQR